MARIDEYTVNVRVKIKWSHLLRLLIYKTLKGRREWTINELIDAKK